MTPANGFELDPRIPFWGANPARAGAAAPPSAVVEEAMPFPCPGAVRLRGERAPPNAAGSRDCARINNPDGQQGEEGRAAAALVDGGAAAATGGGWW